MTEQSRKHEREGRREFKSFLDQSKSSSDWQPTEDDYNHVDGYFKLDGKLIVVEIKTRAKKYLNYPTHIIEIDKYLNITHEKINHNCYTGLYVNIFGDLENGIYDTMYIYNLKDINSSNCEMSVTYANRTTAKNTGKVSKQFYLIPSRYAQKFKKIDNKWIQIN